MHNYTHTHIHIGGGTYTENTLTLADQSPSIPVANEAENSAYKPTTSLFAALIYIFYLCTLQARYTKSAMYCHRIPEIACNVCA